MGRPIKLTPDLQARIVAFLGAGAYVETAAAAAGVSKQTLYNWLSRGADGEEPFEAFLDAVEKAQGEADIRDLKTIRDAANGGVWQAAAWRLERRHPEQWGRRRVEMTGADGGPVDVKTLTLAEVIEEIAALDAEIAALDTEYEKIVESTLQEGGDLDAAAIG